MKVAVTGAGAVLGQGIIKALRASDLPCHILALDPNPLSPGLYWADQAAIVPMADDPGYERAIETMLEREKCSALLVGTDVELAIFAKRREEWEARFGTQILVSDPRVVAIADDKYETARFLEQNGLSFPRSACGDDRDGIAALARQVGFPLIVKPRRGARAVGVSRVDDMEALEGAVAGRNDLVVQQFAGDDDQEYTAGVLCFDGDVKASIILRRDLRDGNTHRAYAGNHQAYEPYVHAMARALGPYGPVNFQFRVDKAGTPRLFEINARFSGTTPMRALFGFNEVDLCLRKILLGEDVAMPSIREGTVVRFLEEQFLAPNDITKVRGQ